MLSQVHISEITRSDFGESTSFHKSKFKNLLFVQEAFRWQKIIIKSNIHEYQCENKLF